MMLSHSMLPAPESISLKTQIFEITMLEYSKLEHFFCLLIEDAHQIGIKMKGISGRLKHLAEILPFLVYESNMAIGQTSRIIICAWILWVLKTTLLKASS